MSNQKNNARMTKKVRDLLNEIEEKISGGNYIYRGESRYYDEISSNLYRQYEGKIDAKNFNIRVVEDEIVEEARGYTSLNDEFEIMAELQHFGGKTNLIDFTKDYRVALFFACNGHPKKGGRLIFLKRNIETEEYKLYKPRNPQNRVIAQKSIFIRPIKGWINPQEEDVIPIPAEIKKNLLDHLNRCHAISTATIYNDLHGFITNQRTHESAYTEFFKGLTAQNKSIKEPDKKEKHLNKAIRCYNESIRLNPQLTVAYNNRGNAKGNLGDHQRAITDYDKAIELNPQYADAYYNRGIAKLNLGDHQGALVNYDKAIKFNPQYAEAYNNRGNAKGRLGDYQGAIADFNKAIELDPQYANAYGNRGFAKDNLGDHQGAIADFNKAIEFNPQFSEAYNNRGNAKCKLSDHRGSIADFDKAIEFDPQFSEAYNNRGNAKCELGDHQGSIADLGKAIEINPQSANYYNSRGATKGSFGDYQGAIVDLDKAIELDPQYASAYNNRGNAKCELGEHQGAIADHNKAIELNPKNVAAHYLRGLAKLQLSDPTAREDFEQTIALAKEQGLEKFEQLAQQELDALNKQKK